MTVGRPGQCASRVRRALLLNKACLHEMRDISYECTQSILGGVMYHHLRGAAL